MNGAMAEALAAAEGEQDMDKKIEQALACPCLGDLRCCTPALPVQSCPARRPPPAPPDGVWVCSSVLRLVCRRSEGGPLRPQVCARLWLLHPQRARGAGALPVPAQPVTRHPPALLLLAPLPN